jgi:hypothetical protein
MKGGKALDDLVYARPSSCVKLFFTANALPCFEDMLMLDALQLVTAILLFALVLFIGGMVGSGIEDALGEKPLRDRARGTEPSSTPGE